MSVPDEEAVDAPLRQAKRLRPGLAVTIVLAIGVAVVGGWATHRAMLAHKLGRVDDDWKKLCTGITAYGNLCGNYYPPDTMKRREKDASWPLTFECDQNFITKQPVGRDHATLGFWCPLTTPIAYVQKLPTDPFNPGHLYGYTCWNPHDHKGVFAILHSPGPDGQIDRPLPELRRDVDAYLAQRAEFWALEPRDRGALAAMIKPYLYDPTNGMISRGDLIRVSAGDDDPLGWMPCKNPWTHCDESDLPLSAGSQQAASASWSPGDPLPPPATAPERANRNSHIMIPQHLQNQLQVAGALKWSTEVNHSALDPLRNQLHADYAQVLAHPRRLTTEERSRFERWRTSAGRLAPLFSPAPTGTRIAAGTSLRAEDVYRLLPLYGKIQLLAAAAEASDGQSSMGLARLEGLRATLAYVLSNSPDQVVVDPFARRVQKELGRLCDETSQVLLSAAPRPQSP